MNPNRSISSITPATFLEVGHTMSFRLMLIGTALLVVALIITLTVNVPSTLAAALSTSQERQVVR